MPNILLVEDEPAIADTLIYAFQTECIGVRHVLTGGDGLLAAKNAHFDLAILDIGLPDMTGIQLCQQLREISPMPIMFLTARADELDRVLGLELGGDDYVTKPFSPREIVARVRAILRRSPHPAPQIQHDVHIPETALFHDSNTRRMYCGVNALDLTAHEYKLLLTLHDHPGRVFSREQLLEHAWQDPGAVTDRTVDAHIKSIRAKLREANPSGGEIIETRRGLGYALVNKPSNR